MKAKYIKEDRKDGEVEEGEIKRDEEKGEKRVKVDSNV